MSRNRMLRKPLMLLLAGIVLAFLAWRVLYKYLLREVAYLLQCFLLALMFTPAYVLEDQRIMAPALIVFLMDVITISPTAGIRALIPLVLALMVGLIVAVLLIIAHRIRLRRRQ